MGWITVATNDKGESLEQNYISKGQSQFYLFLANGHSVFITSDPLKAREFFAKRSQESVAIPA